MNIRTLTAMTAAAALSLASTAAIAGDFRSSHERDVSAGVYFKLPFQGGVANERRDGAKFGFQADVDTFGTKPTGFGFDQGQPQMIDLSFNSDFMLTGAYLNGVDTLMLRDQLYAHTPGEGGFDRDVLWALGILGLGALGAVLAITLGDDDDDDKRDCKYDYDTASAESETTFRTDYDYCYED